MRSERTEIFLYILLSSIIAVCSLLLYSYKNMTGTPYEEIAAYIDENPHVNVTYSVTIDGGEQPLKINQNTQRITLTSPAQVPSLAEQAVYLPTMETLYLDFTPNETELIAIHESFPDTQLSLSAFTIGGVTYPGDATELNLADFAYSNPKETIRVLQALPAVKTVNLMDTYETSRLTLDNVLALQEGCPDVLFLYRFDLFGQPVSTDMESLIYTNVGIGDRGLNQFRRIMPIMKNLTYLRLDTCDTSDAATAQLREELKDKCKVAWRVFFGQNDALTDTYKIWATWNLNTVEVQVLRYCNEVKYLDLGHNHFANMDFLAGMPDLEMAIVAIGRASDISGIANCKKLEFLEIFSNTELTDDDMQHLAGLTNMKYLNISNLPRIRDLSFTDNMDQLRWLWCTMSYVKKDEIKRVQELHPDCIVKYIYFTGDPTDYGWRYTKESGYTQMSPEYALVRARFGYDQWDLSKGERGYLREEITYESLGLTPS